MAETSSYGAYQERSEEKSSKAVFIVIFLYYLSLKKLRNIMYAALIAVGGVLSFIGILTPRRRAAQNNESAGETTKLYQGENSSYQSNHRYFVPPMPSYSFVCRKSLQTSFINENFSCKYGDSPTIYTMPKLSKLYCDDVNKICKVELGKASNLALEKVILLVGATGSGKTTLTNGMLNYIIGVEWADNFRLKLIDDIAEDQLPNQAKSQTKWITSYTIHHQPWFKVPYTFTIIDTPGIGDTAGIQRDKEITEQIKKLFTTKGDNGVDHLDAVGFVSPASFARLTPTQRYIFDSVLQLFGNDLKENIFMMLTFADGQNPQVLSGIREADVPYNTYFQFNNSALYVNNNDDDDDSGLNLHKMFWQLGAQSFDTFINELHHFNPKSLLLTRELLTERKRLENVIIGVYSTITIELNKLEELERDQQLLQLHKHEINRGRDIMYGTKEYVMQTKEKETDEYVTNCTKCQRTCHRQCSIIDDQEKNECSVMHNGHCDVCPEQCSWQDHKNDPFVYTATMCEVNKTFQQLRDKYGNVSGKQLNANQMVKECSNKIKDRHAQILISATKIQKHITRINKIALKPNVPTAIHPLDLLIGGEMRALNPGWEKRMQQLEDVKKQTIPVCIRFKNWKLFFLLCCCIALLYFLTAFVTITVLEPRE